MISGRNADFLKISVQDYILHYFLSGIFSTLCYSINMDLETESPVLNLSLRMYLPVGRREVRIFSVLSELFFSSTSLPCES